MNGITITRECRNERSFCWPPLMELICGMQHARTGDVLAVLADDEESKEVIPLWIARAREELVGTETMGNITRFIVRKAR